MHQQPAADGYVIEIPVKSMDFRTAGEGASRVKETLKKIGFLPSVVRRAAIAAYEAEMNIVIHTHGGVLEARFYPEKVELLAKDKGPGIPDINMAMQEGFSTAPQRVREMGFGAGMGLPNIKKCVDCLSIETEMGKGTLVKMVIFNRSEKAE
ncbi:MAG: anti-sigma regulatory factor [Syntrophomonadaceae bacterium]|jgi:anti-sigma regulatory factor (Ser/Thr protein kinase)|nr:anti-sigma regulatory factor [Syntrophomonadaceae bacterium]